MVSETLQKVSRTNARELQQEVLERMSQVEKENMRMGAIAEE